MTERQIRRIVRPSAQLPKQLPRRNAKPPRTAPIEEWPAVVITGPDNRHYVVSHPDLRVLARSSLQFVMDAAINMSKLIRSRSAVTGNEAIAALRQHGYRVVPYQGNAGFKIYPNGEVEINVLESPSN